MKVKQEKGVRIGSKGWAALWVHAGPTEKEKVAIPLMRMSLKF